MHGARIQHSLLVPMHTLEGFALDDERCLRLRDQTLLDGLMHLGEQLRVFMIATGRVNVTKGMVVSVNDLVLH